MVLKDALDMQLDSKADAISKEDAIREGGVIHSAFST
jgi:hypothetical protein